MTTLPMDGPNSDNIEATAPISRSVPSPRLVNAAHEFEAAMMKELIVPLEPGRDLFGGEDDEQGSSSAMDSFAGEAIGKAISEKGGVGIAKSILQQLSPRSNQSGGSAVPGKFDKTRLNRQSIP